MKIFHEIRIRIDRFTFYISVAIVSLLFPQIIDQTVQELNDEQKEELCHKKNTTHHQ